MGVYTTIDPAYQRQAEAAGMGLLEGAQGGLAAGRDDHPGAGGVQALGGGPADAGGSAHQPDHLASPGRDAGIE